MITTKLIGRLGNNMFQVAACIGAAKRHGTDWCVPSKPHAMDTHPIQNIFPRLKEKVRDVTLPQYNAHDGKDFNYKPIPDNVKLCGFFQSEKYFEGADEEIKYYFELTDHPEFRQYVSIHVRRGDYLQYPNDFPAITELYIKEAMSFFPGREFMFFSDDIDWCERTFPNIGRSLNKSELIDLSCMASCSDHIIANSTFSWWGAWLGKNPKRTVVSPAASSWFGPKNGVTQNIGVPKDLIPNEWIQIKFR